MKVLIVLGVIVASAMAQMMFRPGMHMRPHHMGGKRPSGRPMMGMWNPHRMGFMGHHQMGNRPTGRPMRMGRRPGGRNSDFWNHLKDMVDAWKKSKAQAVDEDETKIIAFSKHFNFYKQQLRKMMANRPTGRPQKFIKAVQKKFKQAVKKLQAMRPTGRPGVAYKKKLAAYMSKLKAYFGNVKQKVMMPKKAGSKKMADETAVLFRDFAAQHLKDMKAHFQGMLNNRPTGRPYAFLKAMKAHFASAMQKLKGMRPTGRPRKGYKKFAAKLRQIFQNAKKMVPMRKKVADETAVRRFSWSQYLKNRFRNRMSHPTGRPFRFRKRPTGRPFKFGDWVKKFIGRRPTGRPMRWNWWRSRLG